MTATETKTYITASKRELKMQFIKYNSPDSFHPGKTIKGAGKGIFAYSSSPMDCFSKDVSKATDKILAAFGRYYLVGESRTAITFAIPQGKKFKVVKFILQSFNAHARTSDYYNSYFTMVKPYTVNSIDEARY
jgi:hypothetical protein